MNILNDLKNIFFPPKLIQDGPVSFDIDGNSNKKYTFVKVNEVRISVV